MLIANAVQLNQKMPPTNCFAPFTFQHQAMCESNVETTKSKSPIIFELEFDDLSKVRVV